jgi:hypothetical protein
MKGSNLLAGVQIDEQTSGKHQATIGRQEGDGNSWI